MDQRITDILGWFSRIYLGGVPQLIQDETAFLSFVCMLAGIEAHSGFRDPTGSGPRANGKRFRSFVTFHFPVEYRPHANNLWAFRNGMAHGFSPRQFVLTTHQFTFAPQKTAPLYSMRRTSTPPSLSLPRPTSQI